MTEQSKNKGGRPPNPVSQDEMAESIWLLVEAARAWWPKIRDEPSLCGRLLEENGVRWVLPLTWREAGERSIAALPPEKKEAARRRMEAEIARDGAELWDRRDTKPGIWMGGPDTGGRPIVYEIRNVNTLRRHYERGKKLNEQRLFHLDGPAGTLSPAATFAQIFKISGPEPVVRRRHRRNEPG